MLSICGFIIPRWRSPSRNPCPTNIAVRNTIDDPPKHNPTSDTFIPPARNVAEECAVAVCHRLPPRPGADPLPTGLSRVRNARDRCAKGQVCSDLRSTLRTTLKALLGRFETCEKLSATTSFVHCHGPLSMLERTLGGTTNGNLCSWADGEPAPTIPSVPGRSVSDIPRVKPFFTCRPEPHTLGVYREQVRSIVSWDPTVSCAFESFTNIPGWLASARCRKYPVGSLC